MFLRVRNLLDAPDKFKPAQMGATCRTLMPKQIITSIAGGCASSCVNLLCPYIRIYTTYLHTYILLGTDNSWNSHGQVPTLFVSTTYDVQDLSRQVSRGRLSNEGIYIPPALAAEHAASSAFAIVPQQILKRAEVLA
jgi:hypothetical protein